MIVAVTLTAAVCLAQEYEYRTTIRLLPNPAYNVDLEVEKSLERFAEHMTPREIEANRASLRPQLLVYRDGFRVDGRTTLAFGDGWRYVETILPQAEGRSSPLIYLQRDGITYTAPLAVTDNAHIENGDRSPALSGPIETALLGRRDLGGDPLATREPNVKALKLEGHGVATVRRSGDEIVLTDSVGGMPQSTYRVVKRNTAGTVQTLDITRYVNGRPHAEERYELTNERPASTHDPDSIVQEGMKVVDTRLGTAPEAQVTYVKKDRIPNMAELRQLAAVGNDGMVAVQNQPVVWPWMVGIGAVLLAGAWWLRGKGLKPAS